MKEEQEIKRTAPHGTVPFEIMSDYNYFFSRASRLALISLYLSVILSL